MANHHAPHRDKGNYFRLSVDQITTDEEPDGGVEAACTDYRNNGYIATSFSNLHSKLYRYG